MTVEMGNGKRAEKHKDQKWNEKGEKWEKGGIVDGKETEGKKKIQWRTLVWKQKW